jgi:MFS family permease
MNKAKQVVVADPVEGFPPGLNNAFVFASCNALSFPIVFGSPMVLYAKSLGASATVLGILAGMMPLLVILQIPAARHVPRFGYRMFVLLGWAARTVVYFALAAVPLLVVLDAGTRLALVLVLMFFFTMLRGISSCAWLPWITSMIPENSRGRYLAIDYACVQLAGFVVVLGAASWLGVDPASWKFAGLFLFGALAGLASLFFLWRIPETAPPDAVKESATPVPWKEILLHPPFRKVIAFVIVWAAAFGGIAPFTVAWLKTEAGLAEVWILQVTATTYLGGLAAVWMTNRRLDAFGSKPMMALAMLLWIGIVACWFALSRGDLAITNFTLIPLHVAMGFAGALVGMSMMRLVMGSIPMMGRSHFFALFSVSGNVAMGASPIVWGVLLDVLRESNLLPAAWNLTNYSVFFAAIALMMMFALALCLRLTEPAAVPMNRLLRDILIDSPQRLWLRFWPRR